MSTQDKTIPVGFKRTEVGVIPIDWEVQRFGEIAEPRKQRIDPRNADPEQFCIELEHIEQETGRLIGSITAGESVSLKSYFVQGDVLFGKLRAYLQKYWLADRQGLCSTEIWVLVGNKSIIPEFLFQQVRVSQFIEAASTAYGTHMPRSDWNVVKNYQLAIPPLSEQGAIATALSDVDVLLASLDTLIAKKKNIKQGAMQELLTGKRRLPGFNGKWKKFNMSKDAVLKARIGWQGLTTTEYRESGDYYLITGTDFLGGRIDWNKSHFVDKNRYDQDKNIQLRRDDILLTKDGTIGKVAHVAFLPGPATLNSGVFVIRPQYQDAFYPRFLYYVLMSNIFEAFLARLQAGSTITHLYQKNFIDFNFLIPEYNEQRVIAELLSDLDADVEVFEKELSKYAQIKIGIMQQLLTGKIRLI